MATTTKNYGLTKPAGTDKYDIGMFNANADKIDAQMKANADAIATKQATITGGATSITSANLTASRALVSDGSGKVAVSAVTSTELGYLDGVTSAIQTQLNGKLASTGTAPKATADANGNNIANTYETKANAITGLDISGKVITYTKGNGTTGTITTQDTNTDTKNTAGSTNTSDKIYLIGATSQAANPQTYSHDTAYVGTDGKLYSGSKVVIASGDTATAASKLATARTIDGVNFNGQAAVTHYGTCATAAATATKAVSITNFTLVTGARVIVKFTVTNTAASPTLNVNNTGAKAIQYRGAAITAGYLAANRTYEFVYDGTNYQLVGDVNTDTNTDTKVRQTNDTTTNASLPVLVSATADSTTERTGTVKYVNGKVYVNPSTGNLFATKFVGPLVGDVTGNVTGNCSGSSGSCTGNAASATKATQDANGKVIADTYATKSGDLAYSSLTLMPSSDGQANINISAWSILNGKMKFISVIGNASDSHDRVVYFPDGYSFSNVGYASALTTYDDKGSNLWSYHGRILERTTTYIKFKFQQTKSGGPSVTDSFKYCLTIFGS